MDADIPSRNFRRESTIAQGVWRSLRDEFNELERLSAVSLDPLIFDFISSGPNGGEGIQLYLDAFQRTHLVPKIPHADARCDTRLEMFGCTFDSPIMIAPTGFIGRVYPEPELAIARAARNANVAMFCSTYTAASLTSIRDELGRTPMWYQLYWHGNADVAQQLLDQAERLGCVGIAVTVDTGAIPMRAEIAASAFADQLSNDPVRRLHGLGDAPSGAVELGVRLDLDALRWICERSNLPVIAKGVLSAECARNVVDCGAQGIVVSNHGGQLLDSGIPSLDALPDVREAVGGELPLLLDSGIRTGADIAKALALGADAVLVGRPCLYGLAVDGEAGVARVLEDLKWDLGVTLANLGCTDLGQLDRSFISKARLASATVGGVVQR